MSSGAKADLVILDGAPYFRMTDEGYLLRQIVYRNSSRRVETVMVDGKVVVDGGELVQVDLSQVLAEAQEIIYRMERTMPDRHAAYARAKPVLDRLEEGARRAELGPNVK